MKYRRSAVAVALSAVCSVFLGGLFLSTSADSTLITFEAFNTGTVDTQDGWTSTGAAGLGCAVYDHAIVDSSVYPYPSFGNRSLRISNAVTSGCFGDQTFSKSLVDEAGETTATNALQSGGTRQKHFEAQFDIASTMPLQQAGMSMSVAPDRGDGSRQSYLRFEDGINGFDVFFDDVQGTIDVGTVDCPVSVSPPFTYVLGGKCANFVETQVASGLSRSVPHTMKFSIDFVDGPSNDVVKIYIDNTLVHIGTTWEDYYRFDSESAAEPTPRTVDSLIFRTGGTPVPSNGTKGFLFDNVSLLSNAPTAQAMITTVVTPANLSTDGVNNSKWFFYNDGGAGNPDGPETPGVPSNSLGSFVAGPGTPPLQTGSAQIRVPGDLYRRNLATYQFAGTPLGAITSLKFSTYNPLAGNSEGVGSQRSGYLNFEVDFNDGLYDVKPGPPDGIPDYRGRLAFIPSVNGTVVQDTWQEWDAIAGGNAKYFYTNRSWPFTTTGPHANVAVTPFSGDTARTWNDLLADYPGIRIHPFYAWFGIRVGEPYPGGYTENIDKIVFGTSTVVKTFDLEPIFLKVHILKYLDGVKATSGGPFPMVSSWNAANIGSGTNAPYILGNNEGGAPDQFGADTSPMSAPADYTTSEVTGGIVVASKDQCAPGKYWLKGYSTSNQSFAAAAGVSPTNPAPAFTGLVADQYLIVWNETCPTTGSIQIVKNTVGGNGTFNFTGGAGAFSIATSGYTGSKTVSGLAPGPISIVETAQAGWTPTSTTCNPVTVVAGATTTCTVVNTIVPPCTDHTPPVVNLYSTLAGPPKKVVLKATDAGGIYGITVIANTNLAGVTYSVNASGTPSLSTFTGQTTVYVFATKLDQNAGSVIGVAVTDKCGNVTNYDPVDVTVNSGRREAVTVEDVAGDENLVKIVNDGLKQLKITVNSYTVVLDLDPKETRIIDIGRALKPGTDNDITFEGRGPRGADAAVIVYPGTADLQAATAGGGHRHRHSVHEAKD